MTSPMSGPWRPSLTASGRPGPPRFRWRRWPCPPTTSHAPRHPWTLVPTHRPGPLHRPPLVPPGCLAASGVGSAFTIASGAWPPATAATPACGTIGGWETLQPPVGYRPPVRQLQSHPLPGLYLCTSLPGGHRVLPQCFSSPLLHPAFWPSTHHRRRHPCAGMGSPQIYSILCLPQIYLSFYPGLSVLSYPR